MDTQHIPEIDQDEVDGLVVVLTTILLEYRLRRGRCLQTAIELIEAVCEVTSFARNRATPFEQRSLFDEVLARAMANRDTPDGSKIQAGKLQ